MRCVSPFLWVLDASCCSIKIHQKQPVQQNTRSHHAANRIATPVTVEETQNLQKFNGEIDSMHSVHMIYDLYVDFPGQVERMVFQVLDTGFESRIHIII